MPETSLDPKQLEKECRVYTRYLIGQNPTDYILEKYAEYHRVSDTFARLEADRFDRLLAALAARGPTLAGLVDSYTGKFHKRSAVRRKLVLLLALLECAPPSFQYLDSTDAGARPLLYLRMIYRAASYGVKLLAAMIFFLPLRLALARAGARSEPRSE